MAGLVSTLLFLVMQYVLLECSKHTLKWVYKPYGIEMCRGLCQKSPDTFYYMQEDLSCHQIPANCSGDAIKVSPKHRLTEESNTELESGCAFQTGLDVCHKKDGETDHEIPDGQQTLVTDGKPQQSTDAETYQEIPDRRQTLEEDRKPQQSTEQGPTEIDHDIPDGQQTVATDREPQQSTDADRNPCKTAEATGTGDVKVVPYKRCKELIWACKTGKMDVVKSNLSQRNTNINCREHGTRKTPVMYATLHGHVSVINYLMSQCCDLTAGDNFNKNVLHMACLVGNPDIVRKLLVSEKCDIDSRDKYGTTPIMFAAVKSHREVFQLLVEQGCNLTAVDIYKNNVLHLACLNKRIDLVKYILSLNIFSIDVKGYVGRTPVMQAAMFGEKMMVKFLVDRGSNLAFVDDTGNNILHLACMRSRHVDTVKYLMTLGAIKGMGKAKNKDYLTPAQVAVERRYKSLITRRN